MTVSCTLQIITFPCMATSTLDGEKPGSALMLTFPHHKPLQPLQSPASPGCSLFLSPQASVSVSRFSSAWNALSPTPAPREKEPKLVSRVGGGCAHTPSDEQRTQSRTPTRAFTRTPKQQGSQRVLGEWYCRMYLLLFYMV